MIMGWKLPGNWLTVIPMRYMPTAKNRVEVALYILMLAWMNREAVEQTLAKGEAHFFSRSRQAQWRKGERSGQTQRVLEIRLDCDGDALRKRLPTHLKIGAVEQIRQLVNLHLPGIRVRALPVAPRQLPFHNDRIYFALELSADERAQLASSGGFAFHAAGELSNLQLAFWAIRS